jgi:tRNA threonylcarbamoyladenosine biosynthesis protein TsaB
VEIPILGPGKPQISTGSLPRELLAGAHELAEFAQQPLRIAVCDEAAALLLTLAWPLAELIHTAPPAAADALTLCAPHLLAADFADLAQLDGHYLRRSDAEIFGEQATAGIPHA